MAVQMRRIGLARTAVLLLLLISVSAAADTLTLKPSGKPRPLQGPIFGASTTAFYERLLDDPAKLAVLKTMEIGLTVSPAARRQLLQLAHGADRDPGEAGQFGLCAVLGQAAANIARGKPKGVSFEQFDALSRGRSERRSFSSRTWNPPASRTRWHGSSASPARASCRSGSNWEMNSGSRWATIRRAWRTGPMSRPACRS